MDLLLAGAHDHGMSIYHDASRRWQDRFDTRRLADRLEQVTYHDTFWDGDRTFVESASMFFLATADADGRPTCNHKGGAPGFVRVVAPDELAFPDFDGNGMFLNIGNISVNPGVGLLFIDFEKPKRLRVDGSASVSRDDPLLAHTVGAQLIVRVKARAIYPNCPRYIPKMAVVEPSIYAPLPGVDAPEPAWKSFADFKDAVHPRQDTFRGDK
jgi:uncharacterized protein